MEKQWYPVYAIPAYLIQNFGDSGLIECHHSNNDDSKKIEVEKDDLRITVELSGGIKILLNENCRVILNENELVVEYLKQTISTVF